MPQSKRKPSAAREARPLNTLKLTPPAKKLWETLPGSSHRELLNEVACFSCEDTNGRGSEVKGRVSRGALLLHGKCNRCGAEAVRIVENRFDPGIR